MAPPGFTVQTCIAEQSDVRGSSWARAQWLTTLKSALLVNGQIPMGHWQLHWYFAVYSSEAAKDASQST